MFFLTKSELWDISVKFNLFEKWSVRCPDEKWLTVEVETSSIRSEWKKEQTQVSSKTPGGKTCHIYLLTTRWALTENLKKSYGSLVNDAGWIWVCVCESIWPTLAKHRWLSGAWLWPWRTPKTIFLIFWIHILLRQNSYPFVKTVKFRVSAMDPTTHKMNVLGNLFLAPLRALENDDITVSHTA